MAWLFAFPKAVVVTCPAPEQMQVTQNSTRSGGGVHEMPPLGKECSGVGDEESFLFGGYNQQKGTCTPVNGPTPVHMWAELTVGIV